MLALATLEHLANDIGHGILGPTIERLRESIPNTSAAAATPFLARFDRIDLSDSEMRVYDQLVKAGEQTRSVRFTYRDSGGRESKRHADPWAFVGVDGKLILVAHDRDKAAIRRFDVSSISELRIQPNVYARPTRAQIESLGAHSVSGLYDETPTNVVVRFDHSLARHVRRQRPLKGATLRQDLLDGSIEAQIPVANIPEFIRWVLGCGPGAEILSPPEVRDAIRHAALAIATQNGGHS
jgi:predicted DNA-binding transcriptional regulator YafY